MKTMRKLGATSGFKGMAYFVLGLKLSLTNENADLFAAEIDPGSSYSTDDQLICECDGSSSCLAPQAEMSMQRTSGAILGPNSTPVARQPCFPVPKVGWSPPS
jgi:hypothetical protein